MGLWGFKHRTLTGQVEGQEFAKDPEQEQRKRRPVCMLQKARKTSGPKVSKAPEKPSEKRREKCSLSKTQIS